MDISRIKDITLQPNSNLLLIPKEHFVMLGQRVANKVMYALRLNKPYIMFATLISVEIGKCNTFIWKTNPILALVGNHITILRILYYPIGIIVFLFYFENCTITIV